MSCPKLHCNNCFLWSDKRELAFQRFLIWGNTLLSPQNTTQEHNKGMSYMCKLESWFVRVVETVHLDHSVVAAHDDVRQAIPRQVRRSQGCYATVLSLIEHVPAITRLSRGELDQTYLPVLCPIEHFLSVFSWVGERGGEGVRRGERERERGGGEHIKDELKLRSTSIRSI